MTIGASSAPTGGGAAPPQSGRQSSAGGTLLRPRGARSGCHYLHLSKLVQTLKSTLAYYIYLGILAISAPTYVRLSPKKDYHPGNML